MRLILMGTPIFAVSIFNALLQAGHDIMAVYSQPPKPAGRGQQLQASPVQQWAKQHHLPIFTPTSLKTPEIQATFKAHQADVAIVAAYGLLLPQAILDAPLNGCLNVHASLLPRWRGAAPIHRTIEAGDAQTGVTIMQMDAGLDTGAMLAVRSIPIAHDTTTPQLHDALATLGASLMCDVLNTPLTPVVQPAEGVTYAAKIQKAEYAINWQQPAAVVARHINAFSPRAWFEHNGTRIKVLQAVPATDGVILMPCQDGHVSLLVLQRAGRTAQEAADFVKGYTLNADVTTLAMDTNHSLA